MNRREFLAALAAPLVLGATPAALARPRGGTPVALVTADLEARVVAVEVATRRVVRSISTLPDPRSAESLHRLEGALVAHTREGAVTLLEGLRVRRVLDGFSAPRYTAVHPLEPLAYVTDSDRGEVVVVDVGQGRIVRRVDVGGPARHVSVSREGTLLWAALGSRASELAVVDLSRPRRPRLVGTVAPPFLAHDVVFVPGGRVWVTSGDRGALALYPPRSREPERVLAADRPPQHVCLREWGRGVAYVTSGKDGTLRVHDLETGRRLRTVPIPRGSYNVTSEGSWIVSPSLDVGTLTVAGTAFGRRVGSVRVAGAAHDACLLVL